MKSHWVEHKGKRVFIADFSNYHDDAAGIRTEGQFVIKELESEPPHSALVISNVEGTFANEDIIKVLVELVPITTKKVKRRAVVGLAGFRRHFLYAFAKVVGDINFTVFDTLLEALDWIVIE